MMGIYVLIVWGVLSLLFFVWWMRNRPHCPACNSQTTLRIQEAGVWFNGPWPQINKCLECKHEFEVSMLNE